MPDREPVTRREIGALFHLAKNQRIGLETMYEEATESLAEQEAQYLQRPDELGPLPFRGKLYGIPVWSGPEIMIPGQKIVPPSAPFMIATNRAWLKQLNTVMEHMEGGLRRLGELEVPGEHFLYDDLEWSNETFEPDCSEEQKAKGEWTLRYRIDLSGSNLRYLMILNTFPRLNVETTKTKNSILYIPEDDAEDPTIVVTEGRHKFVTMFYDNGDPIKEGYPDVKDLLWLPRRIKPRQQLTPELVLSQSNH